MDDRSDDDYEKLDLDVYGDRYLGRELRAVAIPAVVVLALVIAVAVGWYVTRDTGEEMVPLKDIDSSGAVTLDGAYQPDLSSYGPHVLAINVTLAVGDELLLTFSATGPPDGVQARVQRPLHPGGGEPGGGEVLASAVGTNGTIDYWAAAEGAFQIYFWHQGSVREGGEPEEHNPAYLSYELKVFRAHRP
jgi:hypothetical protein